VRRSEQLDLSGYDTDKVPNGYLRYYDNWFAPWVDRPVRLLEIGVHRGGSLALWCDYFPKGSIAGIDLVQPPKVDTRARFFAGSQSDSEFLRAAVREAFDGAPADIVIDDASHLARETKITFDALFEDWLAPGGLYVIEDWGTGFLPGWQDDRRLRRASGPSEEREAPWPSHDAGVVGLVKQWVDELDVHSPDTDSGHPLRTPRFESIEFNPFMVLLRKPLNGAACPE
jgi:hypothetical protein